MYVIQLIDRTKNGRTLYVNQPGSLSSYTTSKKAARTFDSYESALAECCGNERPVKINN